jgi:hypothetical protein
VISSFSHIALLVSSVEASAAFLRTRKIQTAEPETFESEGTKEVYAGSYENQSGLLLLVEAISEGPYKKTLAKRGPSLHHIAIDVLNVEEFIYKAQDLGWKLHPVSSQTIAYKTAWLYLEGIPTLIEVHQKKELSSKPTQVSKIGLPIQKEQVNLFKGLGLGGIVHSSKEISLTVDGHELTFSQIALS